MHKVVRTITLMTLGVALGCGASISHYVLAEREQISRLPVAELQVFAEIFEKIKSGYVELIDDKTLIDHAIHGMLSGLDPHSVYLARDDYQELQIGTTGEFGGLGIEVGMENGLVRVIAPIDDTPAHRAGIQAKDLIVRLDQTPVRGMSLSEAVKRMRGAPGTDINLTVLREGEKKPLEITITRDVIKVISVKGRTLEAGYGYVRITQFQIRTNKNLRDQIARLKDENDGQLKGLILDLRNNPGGVLESAVDVSDAFLEEGLIVYTEGRQTKADMRYSAKSGDLINGAPLVVLVNAGSASASEIVAGALQDHQRAVIMGANTFGKGSVQTVLPMRNGAALKLTTSRYFTPSGISIQAKGIAPDILLSGIKLETIEGYQQSKEVNLRKHLEGVETDTQEVEGDGAQVSKLVKSDYVLFEALNLLKGLTILKGQ